MDITKLNLPQLNEGHFWSVRDHVGNYDDGVYPLGTRVTVGIRKRGFLGITSYVMGVPVALADPRVGDADILDAADFVYSKYQAKYGQ